MKVKVNPGWQLGIEGEQVYQPGETVDVPDALAEQWIAAGQAVALKAVVVAENKAVTSDDTPNKGFTSLPPTPTGEPVKLPAQPSKKR